jgi:hypothetical protein
MTIADMARERLEALEPAQISDKQYTYSRDWLCVHALDTLRKCSLAGHMICRRKRSREQSAHHVYTFRVPSLFLWCRSYSMYSVNPCGVMRLLLQTQEL